MKRLNYIDLIGSAALVLSILSIALCVNVVRAQSLEDTLELELDQMSQPPSTAPQRGDQRPITEPLELDPVPQVSQPAAQPAQAEPVPAVAPMVSESFADAPNTDFENRMFRIFRNAEPMSSAQWSKLIGAKREDTYRVQAGDTLWDISRLMFGDGFFWSKLWAENSSLENPHQIRPGQGMRFVSGDESQAPSLSVVDMPPQNSSETRESAPLISGGMILTQVDNYQDQSRDLVGAAPTYRDDRTMRDISPGDLSSGSVEADELISPPEIPPPTRRSRPVLKDLPSSFAQRKVRPQLAFSRNGLEVEARPALSAVAVMIPMSFLADRPIESVGSVVEVEGAGNAASLGQDVYVEVKGGAQPGQRLSVLMPRGKISSGVSTLGAVGPIVEIGGVIEIIEPTAEQNSVYRATVLSSVNPIEKGAQVVVAALPKGDFSRQGNFVSREFNIIGGELSPDRKILGQNAVVYIDGGASSGVQPGDILAVQSRRGSRDADTKIPNAKRPIGLIKVIKVEQTVATAFVLESIDEIMIGDRTGGRRPEPARSIRETNIE